MRRPPGIGRRHWRGTRPIPFDPLSLATGTLHWSGTDGVLEATPITSWTDQGGGNVLVAEGASTTPDRISSRFVRFVAASTEALEVAASTALLQALHQGTGATIAIGFKHTAATGTEAIVDTHRAINTRQGFSIRGNATAGTCLVRVANGVVNIIDEAPSCARNVSHVVIFSYEEGRAGNEWLISVDGTETTGNSLAAPGVAATDQNVHVGALATATPSGYLSGDVSDIVFVPKYLSAEERALLLDYMTPRLP